MREYKKNELNEVFGKKSLTSPTLLNKVKYIGDWDFLNQYIESKTFSGKELINFFQYPNGLIIDFAWGFSSIKLGLEINSINYFVIEHQDQIITQKNKSIIGRAIIGGVLLGGIGAIIGGATGIGKKDIQLSDLPDNILTISFNENGEEKFLIFSIDNKRYKDVEKFFKTAYPKLYKSPKEINSEIPKATVPTNTLSIAEEIKKFKDLLDMGAITQEEFDAEKQKLLQS